MNIAKELFPAATTTASAVLSAADFLMTTVTCGGVIRLNYEASMQKKERESSSRRYNNLMAEMRASNKRADSSLPLIMYHMGIPCDTTKLPKIEDNFYFPKPQQIAQPQQGYAQPQQPNQPQQAPVQNPAYPMNMPGTSQQGYAQPQQPNQPQGYYAYPGYPQQGGQPVTGQNMSGQSLQNTTVTASASDGNLTD
jgi:hypothetical protein